LAAKKEALAKPSWHYHGARDKKHIVSRHPGPIAGLGDYYLYAIASGPQDVFYGNNDHFDPDLMDCPGASPIHVTHNRRTFTFRL